MANSRKTITSSHTMRQFHLIFNTLSPHNLLFEPHTGEINEQEENQEEYVTKRTKYFELCLVDFEMCGPDILWQFSKDGAPRERHRQILIKMKKIEINQKRKFCNLIDWCVLLFESIYIYYIEIVLNSISLCYIFLFTGCWNIYGQALTTCGAFSQRIRPRNIFS